MAGRAAWWVIPVAIFLFAAVVRLGADADVTAPVVADGAVIAEAASPGAGSNEIVARPRDAVARGATRNVDAPARIVRLRDVTGQDLGSAAIEATPDLEIVLPPAASNQKVAFTLERYAGDAAANAAPFLAGKLRVRANATAAIRGLPAGEYAIAIDYRSAGSASRIASPRFRVPGTLDLRSSTAAAPPR